MVEITGKLTDAQVVTVGYRNYVVTSEKLEDDAMALKLRKSKVAAPICPLAACMTLLGGAWTPNIVWYLSSGPRRFGELRVDISDISAKVLSGRLRELAARRLVTRRVKPTSPPSVEYELTELGEALLPAINAIVEVGKKLKENDVALTKPNPSRHPRQRAALRASAQV